MSKGVDLRDFPVWARWLAAVVFIPVVFGLFSRQGAPVVKNPAPGASHESKQALALLINLSGNLCAEVTRVKPLYGNLYQVDCVRYRDGSGSATYEVDAATGQVK